MKKIFIKIFSLIVLFFLSFSSVSAVAAIANWWNNSQNQAQQSTPNPWEDLTKPTYRINVDNFTPGWKFTKTKTEDRLQWGLLTIIQNLMIPFWVLALFVITIWAWYMILHNWEDEMLNKWKRIFKMWIFSICLALSSYLIIELVKYIIYS